MTGSAPALGQPVVFDPPVLYSTAGVTNDVAAGDLDGDGDLDLVTANSLTDNASVLLGVGDGTFGPPATIPIGDPGDPYNRVRTVALGDLDGDGDLDFVAVATPNMVYTLLGAGDGSFTPGAGGSSDNVVISTAFEAALADFNGDGDLDLAVVSDVLLAVYNGDGAGGFFLSTVVPFDFGFPDRTGLAVGDLDADGAPDVAATNGGTQVIVVLNDGTGALLAPTVYTPLNPPDFTIKRTPDVVAADFDGDGDLDLATPHHVLLNDGSGAFSEGQTGMGSDEGSFSIDAADLDLDGAVDIVFEGQHTDPGGTTVAAIRFARGRGDGTFLPDEPLYPANLGPYPFLSFPGKVAAADLNGDTKPDLAYLAFLESVEGIAVLLNASTGAPDLNLVVEETIAVSDTPDLLPALLLAVVETVGVLDDPALLPALRLAVEERVGVTDTPVLLPALMLAVQERVGVTDTPDLLPALRLLVSETIAVTDSVTLSPALVLAIREAITVADDPDLLASLLLRVREMITVADEVGLLLGVEGLITSLETTVADLLDSGVLSRGEAGSLVRKLDQIRRQAANGKYRTALNQLDAFVRQVESFRADGVLTDEQADALVATARALETALLQESQSLRVAGSDDAAARERPQAFALDLAYPNPFRHTATIPYALAEDVRVRLDVYDTLGRRVAVLVDREQPAGYYAIQLRASALASGTYVYRLQAGPFTGTGTVQVAR